MYEQQLYTRSNSAGIFDDRPGFKTVAATSALDRTELCALEKYCEYPISSSVLEKLCCDTYPYIRLGAWDEELGYVASQSSYRKENDEDGREVFLTHNIILSKAEVEKRGFPHSLSVLTGQVPFITEYEDKGEQLTADYFPTVQDEDFIGKEFQFQQKRLSELGINGGVFRILVAAVLESIGTQKKIFISLECDINQMTDSALVVMEHIYAVLPSELRKHVGYNTFFTGAGVKKNIMIYFLPHTLLAANEKITQIGERDVRNDYIFTLVSPIRIQPQEEFMKIKNEINFLSLQKLNLIKGFIDECPGKLIALFEKMTYRDYSNLQKAKDKYEAYGMLIDLYCNHMKKTSELYSFLECIFTEKISKAWGTIIATKTKLHLERIAKISESIYGEIIDFPTSSKRKELGQQYRNVMENCLCELCKQISYGDDEIVPNEQIDKLFSSHYSNRELREEIGMLQIAVLACKVQNGGEVDIVRLEDALMFLPQKSEQRVKCVLQQLSQNRKSVDTETGYMILISLYTIHDRTSFSELFEHNGWNIWKVLNFTEWYFCNNKYRDRYRYSERWLNSFILNTLSEKMDKEACKRCIQIYKQLKHIDQTRREECKHMIREIKEIMHDFN